MRKTILNHFFDFRLLIVVLLMSAAPVVAASLAESENRISSSFAKEKLARDVYDALRLRWGSRVFSNIESSEQTHMDAIKGLLDS